MISREEFIKIARFEIGTPFHHQGRNPGVALDCLGLLTTTAKRVGIPLDDYNKYRKRPNGTLLNRFRAQCKEIRPEDTEEGDILIFTHNKYKEPWHVGLKTWFNGEPGLLHACLFKKKVFEQRLSSYPHGKLTHAFQVPGVK